VDGHVRRRLGAVSPRHADAEQRGPASCRWCGTSAKSRLMSPGTVMRSVTPWTRPGAGVVGGLETPPRHWRCAPHVEQPVVGDGDDRVGDLSAGAAMPSSA